MDIDINKANTVTGLISGSELGIVMCHTHLLVDPDRQWRPDPDYSLDSVDAAISEVNDYIQCGGKTLIEMTAIGQRRNINDLVRISLETQSHIIMATGFSWEPSMPKFVYDMSVNQITDMLIKEIQQGIEGSKIRAGVIKVGSSLDKITSIEEKVFIAAAQAQKVTGAPISTHTTRGTAATYQVEMLQSLGVDMRKLGIGHIGLKLQYGYFKRVVNSGANVILDCVGKTKYYPDELRANLLKKLIDDGFLNQIMLGCDYGRKSYLPAYNGDPGFKYVITDFVKLLKNNLITDEQIFTMLVENPKNFYSSSCS